jgi:peroxiredoxin
MGRIAYVTSQRAFFERKKWGQDSEFDENAEILAVKNGTFTMSTVKKRM